MGTTGSVSTWLTVTNSRIVGGLAVSISFGAGTLADSVFLFRNSTIQFPAGVGVSVQASVPSALRNVSFIFEDCTFAVQRAMAFRNTALANGSRVHFLRSRLQVVDASDPVVALQLDGLSHVSASWIVLEATTATVVATSFNSAALLQAAGTFSDGAALVLDNVTANVTSASTAASSAASVTGIDLSGSLRNQTRIVINGTTALTCEAHSLQANVVRFSSGGRIEGASAIVIDNSSLAASSGLAAVYAILLSNAALSNSSIVVTGSSVLSVNAESAVPSTAAPDAAIVYIERSNMTDGSVVEISRAHLTSVAERRARLIGCFSTSRWASGSKLTVSDVVAAVTSKTNTAVSGLIVTDTVIDKPLAADPRVSFQFHRVDIALQNDGAVPLVPRVAGDDAGASFVSFQSSVRAVGGLDVAVSNSDVSVTSRQQVASIVTVRDEGGQVSEYEDAAWTIAHVRASVTVNTAHSAYGMLVETSSLGIGSSVHLLHCTLRVRALGAGGLYQATVYASVLPRTNVRTRETVTLSHVSLPEVVGILGTTRLLYAKGGSIGAGSAFNLSHITATLTGRDIEATRFDQVSTSASSTTTTPALISNNVTLSATSVTGTVSLCRFSDSPFDAATLLFRAVRATLSSRDSSCRGMWWAASPLSNGTTLVLDAVTLNFHGGVSAHGVYMIEGSGLAASSLRVTSSRLNITSGGDAVVFQADMSLMSAESEVQFQGCDADVAGSNRAEFALRTVGSSISGGSALIFEDVRFTASVTGLESNTHMVFADGKSTVNDRSLIRATNLEANLTAYVHTAVLWRFNSGSDVDNSTLIIENSTLRVVGESSIRVLELHQVSLRAGAIVTLDRLRLHVVATRTHSSIASFSSMIVEQTSRITLSRTTAFLNATEASRVVRFSMASLRSSSSLSIVDSNVTVIGDRSGSVVAIFNTGAGLGTGASIRIAGVNGTARGSLPVESRHPPVASVFLCSERATMNATSSVTISHSHFDLFADNAFLVGLSDGAQVRGSAITVGNGTTVIARGTTVASLVTVVGSTVAEGTVIEVSDVPRFDGTAANAVLVGAGTNTVIAGSMTQVHVNRVAATLHSTATAAGLFVLQELQDSVVTFKNIEATVAGTAAPETGVVGIGAAMFADNTAAPTGASRLSVATSKIMVRPDTANREPATRLFFANGAAERTSVVTLSDVHLSCAPSSAELGGGCAPWMNATGLFGSLVARDVHIDGMPLGVFNRFALIPVFNIPVGPPACTLSCVSMNQSVVRALAPGVGTCCKLGGSTLVPPVADCASPFVASSSPTASLMPPALGSVSRSASQRVTPTWTQRTGPATGTRLVAVNQSTTSSVAVVRPFPTVTPTGLVVLNSASKSASATRSPVVPLPPRQRVVLTSTSTQAVGATAAAVTSASGSPSGAVFASRISALAAVAACGEEPSEQPIDRTSNPLGLSIGNGRLRIEAGTVVGGVALLGGIAALQLVVAAARFAWIRDHESTSSNVHGLAEPVTGTARLSKPPTTPTVRALAFVRFPSAFVFPAVLLGPAVLQAALAVAAFGDDVGVRSLSAGFIAVYASAALWACRVLFTDRIFVAEFEPLVPAKPPVDAPFGRRVLGALESFLAPYGVWRDRKRARGLKFVKRHLLLFGDYRDGSRGFLAVEIAVSTALACLGAAALSPSASGCDVIGGLSAALMCAHTVAIVARRPYESPAGLFANVLLSATQAVSGVIGAVSVSGAVEDPTALDELSLLVALVGVVANVLLALHGIGRFAHAIARRVVRRAGERLREKIAAARGRAGLAPHEDGTHDELLQQAGGIGRPTSSWWMSMIAAPSTVAAESGMCEADAVVEMEAMLGVVLTRDAKDHRGPGHEEPGVDPLSEFLDGAVSPGLVRSYSPTPPKTPPPRPRRRPKPAPPEPSAAAPPRKLSFTVSVRPRRLEQLSPSGRAREDALFRQRALLFEAAGGVVVETTEPPPALPAAGSADDELPTNGCEYKNEAPTMPRTQTLASTLASTDPTCRSGLLRTPPTI